ncbi:MAG: HEAT repeat domain-containing protein [Promethearchaeota archaeon]
MFLIKNSMDHKAQNEKYNKLIRQLFDSEEWELRAAAAREIGHMGEGRAVNLLIKVLEKEGEPAVINNLIEALGRIANGKATQSILNFLQVELNKSEERQDKERLFIIIEALMRIGDKRALEQLGILQASCMDEQLKGLTEKALSCVDPKWKENIKKSKTI